MSFLINPSILQLTACEFRARGLKQKFNIVGATGEIHGWDTSHADNKQNDPTDRRWEERDMKLEVQVLNEDIRRSLPHLENEALRLEADIFAIEKAAKLAVEKQKELPPLLNKTALELEVEMGQTAELRMRIKAAMQHDIDHKRKEKAQKVQRVGALREQLALTADEADVLRGAVRDLHRQELAEQQRIGCLRSALESAKEQFNNHHGVNGWIREAWRTTNLEAGRAQDAELVMSVTDAARGLQRWLPPKSTGGAALHEESKKFLIEKQIKSETCIDFDIFTQLAQWISSQAC